MEIKKFVNVTLTTEELREIIVENLKSKGINVTSVFFNVSGHETKGDYFANQPLDYRLDDVTCKGEI